MTADKLTTWEPSEILSAAIRESNRQITVTEESNPPVSRRLQLRVAWANAAGQEVEPVKLTTWKFRQEPQR